MIQCITILLLFLLGFACKSNKLSDKDLTVEEWEQEEKNHECTYRTKYSLKDRQKMYPYNKASKVLIVSFEAVEGETFLDELPKQNNKIDLAALSEKIALSKSGIDSLTDILFNVGYSGEVLTGSISGCYNPRNAILFLKNNEVFEYIEICFECNENRISSDKVKFGDLCDGKYEAIRELFKSKGIRIGISDEH